MRIASATCAPILNTGLSDVIGSWKTMAMSLPRTLRISFSDSDARSRPLKRISPPVIFPGCATRRMIDIAVTLLPQPDSPTSATASPRRTLNETLSTASTAPSAVKNVVRRFFTSSSASAGLTSASATRAPGNPSGCFAGNETSVTRGMVARLTPESRQERSHLGNPERKRRRKVHRAEESAHQRRLGDDPVHVRAHEPAVDGDAGDAGDDPGDPQLQFERARRVHRSDALLHRAAQQEELDPRGDAGRGREPHRTDRQRSALDARPRGARPGPGPPPPPRRCAPPETRAGGGGDAASIATEGARRKKAKGAQRAPG